MKFNKCLLVVLIFTVGCLTVQDSFMFEASEGQTHRLMILLDMGAKVNAKTRSGETALMLASRNGHINTVRFLIEKGADVNTKSKWGTALHYAAGCGIVGNERTDLVKVLLKNGADVNIKNEDGLTPLMGTAITARPDTARLLLNNGANVNTKTDSGWTALMYVVWMAGVYKDKMVKEDKYKAEIVKTEGSFIKYVKVLIQAGSDLNVKNKDGETALMLAKKCGNEKIVEILKKEMVKE